MNLDTNFRNDFVTVDANLTPSGWKMVNLLGPEKQVAVDRDRVQYWLGVGAQPTDTTAGLLRRAGIRKTAAVPASK